MLPEAIGLGYEFITSTQQCALCVCGTIRTDVFFLIQDWICCHGPPLNQIYFRKQYNLRDVSAFAIWLSLQCLAPWINQRPFITFGNQVLNGDWSVTGAYCKVFFFVCLSFLYFVDIFFIKSIGIYFCLLYFSPQSTPHFHISQRYFYDF